MSDKDLADLAIERCLEEGFFERNYEGSIVLSDMGAEFVTKLINDRPELFAQFFPDRLQ